MCIFLYWSFQSRSSGDLMGTKQQNAGELKIYLKVKASHFVINKFCTAQPNLILDSRTPVSLDSFCHHQITYYKVDLNIPR